MFIPFPLDFSDVLRSSLFFLLIVYSHESSFNYQPRKPHYGMSRKSPSIYNPSIKVENRPPDLLEPSQITVHRMTGIRVTETSYLGYGGFNVVLGTT